MDHEDSGIDSDPKNQVECEVTTKSSEPIITFSPDRCRFNDNGGHKSRNSSIASDFELNSTIEYSYSAAPPTNGDDSQDPSATTTTLTDLLSTSPKDSPSLNNNNKNLNGGGMSDGGGENNLHSGSIGVSDRSQQAMQNGVASTISQPANPPVPSSLQLQKRLEKQIAQASAIAAALSNSTKEESEFGEWNSNTDSSKEKDSISSTSANPQQTSAQSVAKSKPQKSRDANKVVKVDECHNQISKAEVTEEVFRKPHAVKFQENEVEIISKSSRRASGGKVPGGLIPPERLAVPNKGLSHSNRKHSAKSGPDALKISVINAPSEDSCSNPTGNTSEIKPLVQWDSDESEDELSFFPTGNKSRGKLTDNLSIDNMSLSGEEDDLHLSPPRQLTQKCPCDPRQWINENIPKSYSFSRQSGQCVIS